MREFSKTLINWLPALVWMALIFTASGDTRSYQHSSLLFEPLLRWLFPHLPPEQIERLHHLFRKCCHVGEYAILALLLWHALQPKAGRLAPAWDWRRAGWALALVFLYAASDEFHQLFVPTRTARVTDVMIDTTGGVAGLCVVWLVVRWRKPAEQ